MKVIAADISNLTDARYFAAWGVDVLAYKVDYDQPNTWQSAREMIDWVEGPTPAIKVDGLEVNESHIACIQQLDVSHILAGAYIDTAALPTGVKATRIVPSTEIDHISESSIILIDKPVGELGPALWTKINTVAATHEVFLDGPIQRDDLDLIANSRVAGIVLRGGDEEKVGYKSYDELDDLLEYIYQES